MRWLRHEPSDLDLHCFQKRINPGLAGEGLRASMICGSAQEKMVVFAYKLTHTVKAL